jgi:NAD-dependent dihydropyrimidine dehydrogenase PreA subunit
MSEEKYKLAARAIVKAGMFPFPLTDNFLRLVKLIVSEEDLDFVLAFKRKVSQSMDELKQRTKLSEEEINKHANSLAKVGLIFNQPSSSGVMVFRLLPLIMVGVYEYTFMKKLEYTEKEKEIAILFKNILDDYRDFIQQEYDTVVPMLQFPPFDRTLPIRHDKEGEEISIEVNENIEVPKDKVLPVQKVEELIEKFDEVAVGYCFCRHHVDLLGESCEISDEREVCMTFGKSARHTANHGFARMIDKDEALKILRKCADLGFVHKVFHVGSDIYRDETSICNCCKDCCGTFDMWKTGMAPMVNSTNYLSNIEKDLCTGCGICVEKCPVDAIKLDDENLAERNEAWCIGCGICAHFCPENAISLIEGLREVNVPPPRLRAE